jgi:hypothetical protein
MSPAPDRGCSVAVVPSTTSAGCYGWVIRSLDGQCLAHPPYAFATKAAARLSGECWKHAMISGSSTA